MRKHSSSLINLFLLLSFIFLPIAIKAQRQKTKLPNQKATTTRATCNLNLQQAPLVQGVRVGMSKQEAQNAFLSSPSLAEVASMKNDVIGFSVLMSKYVYQPATGKAPELKAELQARMLDNRVFAVSWELIPLQWYTPNEATKSLSEQWKVPVEAWIVNKEKNGYAELQCKGFTAWVDTELYDFAGRHFQRMGIFEPTLLAEIEKRDAKQKQEEEQKRRNRIKP